MIKNKICKINKKIPNKLLFKKVNKNNRARTNGILAPSIHQMHQMKMNPKPSPNPNPSSNKKLNKLRYIVISFTTINKS